MLKNQIVDKALAKFSGVKLAILLLVVVLFSSTACAGSLLNISDMNPSSATLIVSTETNPSVVDGLSMSVLERFLIDASESGISPRRTRLVLGKSVSAVPLPAAAWLFGSVLIGLGFIGRRHSQRSTPR